ncbi:MAG TPA: universal stress protein [Holophagaceae bacterium]|nr:universal stress protein [Holophagaceae bacterium]
MIKEVLVGVDFSTASRQALDRAAAWSARLEVPLKALHVLQPPAPMLPEAQIALPDQAWLDAMEGHAREQLEGWIKGLPQSSSEVRWGSPSEELVAACSPESLLVVAQVGHTTLERLLFGSTAARVVRHAPCDVLVVRSEAKG